MDGGGNKFQPWFRVDDGMIPAFDATSNSDFTLANTANKAIVKRQQLTEEEYHSRVKGLIHELKPEMETVRVLHRQLGAKWNMLYFVVLSFLRLRKAHIKHLWEKEVLNAVVLIQSCWRARMARRNVKALKSLGPTFKNVIWRYILKIKCKRRLRKPSCYENLQTIMPVAGFNRWYTTLDVVW